MYYSEAAVPEVSSADDASVEVLRLLGQLHARQRAQGRAVHPQKVTSLLCVDSQGIIIDKQLTWQYRRPRHLALCFSLLAALEPVGYVSPFSRK